MDISKKIVIVLFLGLVLGFFLSLKTVEAEAGQVTLEPTDDTFVVSTIPDSNYGGQNYLQIMNFVNGTYPDNFTCLAIIWLKFNLSIIPKGAVVDEATLQLFTVLVSGTFNVHAYSCSSTSWAESVLTYSNMPSYGTTSITAASVGAIGQWYDWSVVGVVRNAVNRNYTFLSIVLSDPALHDSASVAVFRSKDPYSPDSSPKLTVHWIAVAPEFPSFFVLFPLMIATLFTVAIYKKRSILHERFHSD